MLAEQGPKHYLVEGATNKGQKSATLHEQKTTKRSQGRVRLGKEELGTEGIQKWGKPRTHQEICQSPIRKNDGVNGH